MKVTFWGNNEITLLAYFQRNLPFCTPPFYRQYIAAERILTHPEMIPSFFVSYVGIIR